MDLSSSKPVLREEIWSYMENSGVLVFPLSCQGRIPNFVGAQIAAQQLQKLGEWRKAEVVFASPDSQQRPIREKALKDGKVVIMAFPRLMKVVND